ncbi:MAG: hypothetical protein WDA08_04165 [Weeksellaceae bacterium]
MKKILIIIGLLSSVAVFSQVAIGKDEVSSASVSLDFGEEPRGLLLPWVDDVEAMNNPVNGTIIYDLSDHKVKVRYDNDVWEDLSIISGDADDSIQNGKSDVATAKVSLGTPAQDSPDGILVLEETDKAMVLPKVIKPHLNIENPSPGMMVYDPEENLFCIYNGTVWTFWKANN